MQSNTLSTYNTKVASTEKKVQNAKAEQTSKLAAVKNGLQRKEAARDCVDRSRSGDFDFAGLAG